MKTQKIEWYINAQVDDLNADLKLKQQGGWYIHTMTVHKDPIKELIVYTIVWEKVD